MTKLMSPVIISNSLKQLVENLVEYLSWIFMSVLSNTLWFKI